MKELVGKEPTIIIDNFTAGIPSFSPQIVVAQDSYHRGPSLLFLQPSQQHGKQGLVLRGFFGLEISLWIDDGVRLVVSHRIYQRIEIEIVNSSGLWDFGIHQRCWQIQCDDDTEEARWVVQKKRKLCWSLIDTRLQGNSNLTSWWKIPWLTLSKISCLQV